MSIEERLAAAMLFTSPRWRAARDAGRTAEEALWSYLYDLTSFIRETGQAFHFESSVDGSDSASRPRISAALGSRASGHAREALELLLKAWDETAEPAQRQPVLTLIGLLNFIADTGQLGAFEDYFSNRLEHAPLAMAYFSTRDEAETWLKGLAEPPSPARILIGDAYHGVWCTREGGSRHITREYVIEPYIEALTARGVPASAPSFETRAQAEAWLTRHPVSPFGFVSIAGETHLAVHHKRLQRHTLHPVACALKEWEQQKQRASEGS